MKRTKRIICKAVKIYEKDNENNMRGCLDIWKEWKELQKVKYWIHDQLGMEFINYLLTPTECVLYIVLQYLLPVNNGNLLDWTFYHNIIMLQKMIKWLYCKSSKLCGLKISLLVITKVGDFMVDETAL